ncbi:hypothetical protein EDD85DRAFT_968434, partial [Armillaria nabsnona]
TTPRVASEVFLYSRHCNYRRDNTASLLTLKTWFLGGDWCLWGEYSAVQKRDTRSIYALAFFKLIACIPVSANSTSSIMSLVSAKSEGSSPLQDTQNDPAFHSSASTPPRWPGFYQQPVENDIIDGTDWIDSLWAILHRFSFVSPTRTKALHAIYDIIEYRGYLESVCAGLINDILQEIKDNDSEMVSFNADVRRRCKIAGPELEHKMSMLQAIVIRQHRDFSLENLVKTISYLQYGGLAVVFLICCPLHLETFVPALSPWLSDESPTCFVCIVFLGCNMFNTGARLPAYQLLCEADGLNTNTFQLIGAVRDMPRLLALIAESEGSPMSDVLHAERFLKAFQYSVCHDSFDSFYHSFKRLVKFLGGRQELSDLRSWLQELPSWTDKNFGAYHWTDHNDTSPRDNTSHYIPYQAPSTHTRRRSIFPRIPRFSSIKVTRIYQDVFGTYSRSGILPTTSSRQVERQIYATTNAKASDTARFPVSTASGDGLSMAIFGYSRGMEDYA